MTDLTVNGDTEFDHVAALTIKATEAVTEERRNGGGDYECALAAVEVFRLEYERKLQEMRGHLERLVDAAEDVLTEAEADETAAVFDGTADPARLGTPARKRLREAINAVPVDALTLPAAGNPQMPAAEDESTVKTLRALLETALVLLVHQEDQRANRTWRRWEHEVRSLLAALNKPGEETHG